MITQPTYNSTAILASNVHFENLSLIWKNKIVGGCNLNKYLWKISDGNENNCLALLRSIVDNDKLLSQSLIVAKRNIPEKMEITTLWEVSCFLMIFSNHGMTSFRLLLKRRFFFTVFSFLATCILCDFVEKSASNFFNFGIYIQCKRCPISW